jgi:hypothetical protein
VVDPLPPGALIDRPIIKEEAIMYVIVVGNPFDGMTIYGVFKNKLEATKYAIDEFGSLVYWAAVPVEEVKQDGN